MGIQTHLKTNKVFKKKKKGTFKGTSRIMKDFSAATVEVR
jgi:hypothetical protein